MLHSGGLVPGDARVVSVMHQGQVGDPQGAGEVDVVNGYPEARWDWPAILLPSDGDGQVPGDHHTGDEDPLPDGESRELEGLDEGWDCKERLHRTDDQGLCPSSPSTVTRSAR